MFYEIYDSYNSPEPSAAAACRSAIAVRAGNRRQFASGALGRIRVMDFTSASYEVQIQGLNNQDGTPRRMYSVRVTPIPLGTWYLQVQTHKYRPYLRYWAMGSVPDSRHPERHYPEARSTWTLWFTFREPPMEHLDWPHHEGMVAFAVDKEAPHDSMVTGLAIDLIVGPTGTIGRAVIL